MKISLKRVVLVSTGISRKEYPYLPSFMYLTSAGIHYINAILKENGFETSIIDQANDNLSIDEIGSLITDKEPDIVLFNQFFSTREKIKNIISELPEKYTIGVGGHDATFHSKSLPYNDFIKQYRHVDFVWQGEAENGLVEFLKNFIRKNEPVIVKNIENRIQDLDSLPVLKHDDYNGEMGFLITSRGCLSNGCEFCTTPQFYRDGLRSRSAEHVEEELENLKNNGKKFLFIFDDNFLGFSESDMERAAKIIKKCKSLDMKLFIMTTVKQIVKADEKGRLADFCGTLTMVFLGVENGDMNALKKIGKKCNFSKHREMSIRAIDALYKNGISTYPGYINFNPETTFDELRTGALFLYENNSQASNFHNLYNRLDLHEGTNLFDRYNKMGLYIISKNEKACNYEFTDPNVGFFSNFLSMFVVDYTYIIDFLDYEAEYLIFMNHFQNEQVGKEYINLKKHLNENNYRFFIKALNSCMENPSIGPLLDILGGFIVKTKNLIMEYKKLIPEILKKAEYINNGPLSYIAGIDV